MGGPGKPKSGTPKSQPSISRFFAVRPSPKSETSSTSSPKVDTPTKRKLDIFSHSPSKKSRPADAGDSADLGSGSAVSESSDAVSNGAPTGPDSEQDPATEPAHTFSESPQNKKEDVPESPELIPDETEEIFPETAAETVSETATESAFGRFRMGTSGEEQDSVSEASRTKSASNSASKSASKVSSKSASKPHKSTPKPHKSTPKPHKSTPTSASNPAKLTPLEQQFKDLKARHSDKVLAIQVGYKYKFFGEDAVIAAQLLNIMLIPGNLGLDDRQHDRYAYCSIPDNRLHIHLQRLLNHGLKVGVVKQTETAAVKSVEAQNKSSLFERRVTAVYTKATYMGDEAADGGRAESSGPDRYILCIDESEGPGKTGIVAVSPATGDIVYDAFQDTLTREHLETRLAYLNPSEVLVIGSGEEISRELSVVLRLQNVAPKFQNVAPKLQNVAPKFQNVAPKLQNVAPKFENVAPKFQNVAPKLQNVAPKLQNVAPKFENVAPKFENGPVSGPAPSAPSSSPGSQTLFFQCKPEDDVQAALFDFFQNVGTSEKYAHLAEYYTQHFPACVLSCVHELIVYLSEFNLSNVFTITSNIAAFADAGKYMVLPAATLRALDIFCVDADPRAREGSLFWLMDHTHTRKGASMLREWVGKPLVDRSEIEKRLDAVGSLASSKFVHVLDTLRTFVAKIGRSGVDLDRSLIKIHYSATYATEKIARKDLYLMLRTFGEVLQLFRSFGGSGLADLKSTFSRSELLTDIIASLSEASQQKIVDRMLAQINAAAALSDRDVSEQKTRFFVHEHSEKYRGISDEYARIAEIEQELETELRAIRKLLKRPQLAYVTNIKDTHLIEVRNGKTVDSLPADWLRISGTKSVSRFRTPAVSRLHKQLQYHNERLLRESDACFNAFLQEVDSEYAYLREIVNNLARFDCLLSLSTVAQMQDNASYVRPSMVDDQIVNVHSGCHPILSKLPQNLGAYVPNDVSLSHDKNKVLIITGPNMGGKSSLVKQIALFVIMAQVGSFVPCAQATLGIFDSIYIRMGASDNILRGKSTFMVEMSECASIIQNYTPKSLIILDEIGRGTGTSDGIALAYSILKYIIEDRAGPLTLFITHYPSLHVLEQEHDAVTNHHMAFVEKHSSENAQDDWPEVVFLYKLVAGVVSNSYGLNVAKLAGIEKAVIDSAYKISEAMKADVERGEILQKLSELSKENAFETLYNLF